MKTKIFGCILAVLLSLPAVYVGWQFSQAYLFDAVDVEEPLQHPAEPPLQNAGLIEFQVNPKPVIAVGSSLTVATAKVVDGYQFILVLENGEQIKAHLASATKPEATITVTQWLKELKSAPKVQLLRQIQGIWIVDFQIEREETATSLLSLLKEKELLL